MVNKINNRDILISIVSHKQGRMVQALLNDIESFCDHTKIFIVLTINIDEILPFEPINYSYPIDIKYNKKIRGYAENHNRALLDRESKYICVMNPDIRLIAEPFSKLIERLNNHTSLVAPLVRNNSNEIEDNARYLPTIISLLKRIFNKKNDYLINTDIIEIDWAAGMFLFLNSEMFQLLEGFDEKFFLYCEDIDICSRVWLSLH